MNLYTCYTPSHKPLYWKYMVNTVYFDTSLVVHELPEIGDGTYRNPKWTVATHRKILMIQEVLKADIDDIFMFSDVDVQFFGPLTDIVTHSIRDYDIVTQADPSRDYDVMHCTGFMAIRVNDEMRDLFKKVLIQMAEKPNLDDQDAFNVVVREGNYNIGTFDPQIVWSHRQQWNPDDPISVPKECAVHHANWVHGVRHKAMQLDTVRNQYHTRYGEITDRQKIELSKRKLCVL